MLHTILRIIGGAPLATQDVVLLSFTRRRAATQGLRFENQAWALKTLRARLLLVNPRRLKSAVNGGTS